MSRSRVVHSALYGALSLTLVAGTAASQSHANRGGSLRTASAAGSNGGSPQNSATSSPQTVVLSPGQDAARFRAERSQGGSAPAQASAPAGATTDSAANVTVAAAANDNVFHPNLTAETVRQPVINNMGGFYVPGGSTFGGVSEGAPSGAAASASYGGGAVASAAPVAGGAPTGVPAYQPLTSLDRVGPSLATLVARMEGTGIRRLPNTALRGGALAVISGAGQDVSMKTALPTFRVQSWDGETLVVVDQKGARRTFRVDASTRVPRNLQAGKLVVLDVRGDRLRAVTYLL